MKKILLLSTLVLAVSWGVAAQNIDDAFFTQVSYVGAFDGIEDWTAGWANWDPVNTAYPDATVTKGNGVFSRSGGTHISANETWSGVIRLNGWVYVDEGVTLTLQPGTIIRGTEKSVLVIERGGKIHAVGSPTQPIVFTSNKGAGFRGPSDWGGLVICGKAPNNLPGGTGIAEGGIESPHGGNDPADNSGTLAFVRIEFPGYEVATGSEINGLSFYSAGSQTQVDHIQVSSSGDDAFEWFGGSVNAKYLISYKTEDDDFDTDNGFCGRIQFGLILRDPNQVDSDTANGFESDNDASGSNSQPRTKAIFSNISGFGPAKDEAAYNALPKNHKEGASARLRRNTSIKIFNSLFLGFGRGIRLESAGSQTAAQADELTIQNSFIGGIYGEKFLTDGAAMTNAQLQEWFLDNKRKNRLLNNLTDAQIANPFSFTNPDFRPLAGSPVFNASCWVVTSAGEISRPAREALVANYPNPFRGTTRIELTLDRREFVQITVYTLNGSVVATLQNGELPGGTHRFDFDARQLPKGIYLGRVVSGEKTGILKMVAE